MQRSLDLAFALKEIGHDGDFRRIPAVQKQCKSHRQSELIRLGLWMSRLDRGERGVSKALSSLDPQDGNSEENGDDATNLPAEAREVLVAAFAEVFDEAEA
jgi:hypothetical protein